MIDPQLALSLAVESNHGVYALLLGSGVSRSAEILTGWEVVLDLIHQLAIAGGEDCGPNPVAWLKERHDMEPDYSKLLDAVGKTPAERRQILNSYFEPTEDEREQNKKEPAKAHEAIARLVAGGFVKVIVTTNFDRLTERAIQAVGISPTVVSTPDACAGMLPLTQQKCVIVKLHGDYKDVRIKNTPEELATYARPTRKLLDQILDEFGLIVCGWSGEWDTALRAAIERCPSRRFSTFWTVHKGNISDTAERLIKRRHGQTLQISDADSFFTDLADRVQSLADSRTPHPLSVASAVATAKRFLAEDRYRIRLNDLLKSEAQKAAKEIRLRQDEWTKCQHTSDIPRLITDQLAITEVLRNLIVTGCYWGRTDEADLVASCIRIVAADPNLGESGIVIANCLRLYPAMTLLYAGGIAALAAHKEDTLARLFKRVTVAQRVGAAVPLVHAFRWDKFLDVARQLVPTRKFLPVSEHFYSALQTDVVKTIVEREMYDDAFDGFEYRSNLCFIDCDNSDLQASRVWGPLCRFTWKFRSSMYGTGLLERHADPIIAQGENWPFLKEGLFQGSVQRLQRIMDLFGEHSRDMGQRMI